MKSSVWNLLGLVFETNCEVGNFYLLRQVQKKTIKSQRRVKFKVTKKSKGKELDSEISSCRNFRF